MNPLWLLLLLKVAVSCANVGSESKNGDENQDVEIIDVDVTLAPGNNDVPLSSVPPAVTALLRKDLAQWKSEDILFIYEQTMSNDRVHYEMKQDWNTTYKIISRAFQTRISPIPCKLLACIPLALFPVKSLKYMPLHLYMPIFRARISSKEPDNRRLLDRHADFPKDVWTSTQNLMFKILYFPGVYGSNSANIFNMNHQYRNYENLKHFMIWHMACEQYYFRLNPNPELKLLIQLERAKALHYLRAKRAELEYQVAAGQSENSEQKTTSDNITEKQNALKNIRILLEIYASRTRHHPQATPNLETFYGKPGMPAPMNPSFFDEVFDLQDAPYSSCPNPMQRILYRLAFYIRLSMTPSNPIPDDKIAEFVESVPIGDLSAREADTIVSQAYNSGELRILHRYLAKENHPVKQSLRQAFAINQDLRKSMTTSSANTAEKLRAMAWTGISYGQYAMRDELMFPKLRDNTENERAAKRARIDNEFLPTRLSDRELADKTSAYRKFNQKPTSVDFQAPNIDSAHLNVRFHNFLEKFGTLNANQPTKFDDVDPRDLELFKFRKAMMSQVVDKLIKNPVAFLGHPCTGQVSINQTQLSEALNNLVKVLLLPVMRIFKPSKRAGVIPLPLLSPTVMGHIGAFHGLMLSKGLTMNWPFDPIYMDFLFYKETRSAATIAKTLYGEDFTKIVRIFDENYRVQRGFLSAISIGIDLPFDTADPFRIFQKYTHELGLSGSVTTSEMLRNSDSSSYPGNVKGLGNIYRTFMFKQMTDALLLGRFEYQRHLRMFFFDSAQFELTKSLVEEMFNYSPVMDVNSLCDEGIVFTETSATVTILDEKTGEQLPAKEAFKRILRELNQEDLKLLVWFVTGSLVSPVGGFKGTNRIAVHIETESEGTSTADSYSRTLQWKTRNTFEATKIELIKVIRISGGYKFDQ